jgi:Cofactor assembly of complex C subunit B
LTTLAALGLFCLSLLLSILFSITSPYIFLLILLSPGAGIFYWKKAGRWEDVAFKVDNQAEKTRLTVKANRDELRQLQDTLTFLERQSE